MIKIEIYSKDLCAHCSRAKNLLNNLEIPFTEIDVTNPEELHTMLKRSGGARSVPQIFISSHTLHNKQLQYTPVFKVATRK